MNANPETKPPILPTAPVLNANPETLIDKQIVALKKKLEILEYASKITREAYAKENEIATLKRTLQDKNLELDAAHKRNKSIKIQNILKNEQNITKKNSNFKNIQLQNTEHFEK